MAAVLRAEDPRGKVIALHLGDVKMVHSARKGVELQYDRARRRWIEVDEHKRARVLNWPHGSRSILWDDLLRVGKSARVRYVGAIAAAVAAGASLVSWAQHDHRAAGPAAAPPAVVLNSTPAVTRPVQSAAVQAPTGATSPNEQADHAASAPAEEAPAPSHKPRGHSVQASPNDRVVVHVAAQPRSAPSTLKPPPVELLAVPAGPFAPSMPRDAAPVAKAPPAKAEPEQFVLVDRSTAAPLVDNQAATEPSTGKRATQAQPKKPVAPSVKHAPPSDAEPQSNEAPAAKQFRLLAVLASAVVISDPKSGLPRQVNVGAQLPSGEVVKAVDREKGVAITDSREIRLQ